MFINKPKCTEAKLRYHFWDMSYSSIAEFVSCICEALCYSTSSEKDIIFFRFSKIIAKIFNNNIQFFSLGKLKLSETSWVKP